MNKSINTLVPDIQEVLLNGSGDWESAGAELGERIGEVLQRRLRPDDDERVPKVWFSNAGSPCVRKLWYKLHKGSHAEPLRPNALLKFTYGDILEELVLELARLAGHEVGYEQHRLEYRGITGRIDGVIDGVLVDVKSASGYGFRKFQSGNLSEDDPFGYLGQLGGYLLAAREAGLPVEPNRAAFLVVNKETGDLHLDEWRFADFDLEEIGLNLEANKSIAESYSYEPDRAFSPEPEGKSGNMKLGVNCSYCEFKGMCWPGLKGYAYKGKAPVFLTTVAREPNVPEISVYRRPKE